LAIQTALRVGVDKKIIETAMEFLSPEHRQYQENLKEVESIRGELIKIREDLRKEKLKAKEVRLSYEKMAAELKKNQDKILAKAQREAESKIDSLLSQARVEDTFRKHEKLQQIKKELPQIVKTPPAGSKEHSFAITSPDEFSKRFPPGSKVFVPQLNSDAVVQGNPNSKGEIPILSNSMRLMVLWEELKPPQKAINPTQEILRKTSRYAANAVDSDRVIDIRGMNSEDAIGRIEVDLDKAALAGEDRLKIIHGHGTETLKRSVRSHLSRSVYVKKWNAGTIETGGDGVTWVEIKD